MHTLWAGRMKPPRGELSPPADPRLFCPRSRASDTSGAVRFARLIAQLGPVQRGTLHLVYGERLSYDEVAEVFGVPVSKIMARLVRSHQRLARIDEHEAHAVAGGAAGAAAQRSQPQPERGAQRPGRAA
jgi:DNA-directed RNA polymerase specialized sigma24 family protein